MLVPHKLHMNSAGSSRNVRTTVFLHEPLFPEELAIMSFSRPITSVADSSSNTQIEQTFSACSSKIIANELALPTTINLCELKEKPDRLSFVWKRKGSGTRNPLPTISRAARSRAFAEL